MSVPSSIEFSSILFSVVLFSLQNSIYQTTETTPKILKRLPTKKKAKTSTKDLKQNDVFQLAGLKESETQLCIVTAFQHDLWNFQI